MLRKYVVVDIDGTISNSEERAAKYLTPQSKDWDSFYQECGTDKPIKLVCELVELLIANGYTPIFLTGRPERVRDITSLWLEKNIKNYIPRKDFLFMRKNHDYTPDFEYKRTRLFNELSVLGVTPENTLVLEDRKSCVDMWREQGFTVLQPADGNY